MAEKKDALQELAALLSGEPREELQFLADPVPDDENAARRLEKKERFGDILWDLIEAEKNNGLSLDKIHTVCQACAYPEIEEYIVSRIQQRLRPVKELAFLVQRPDAEDLIRDMYRFWLHHDSRTAAFCREHDIERSDFKALRTLLNTVSSAVIEDNLEEPVFLKTCAETFTFPEELSRVLWELYDGDRQTLIVRALLQRMRQIEQHLNRIDESFSTLCDAFIDEDDEDTEE